MTLRFTPITIDPDWEDPTGVIHIYARPNRESIQGLLSTRPYVDDVAIVSQQPAEFLHLTVARFAAHGREVSSRRLGSLQDSLTQRLSTVGPIVIALEFPRVRSSGIVAQGPNTVSWLALAKAISSCVNDALADDRIAVTFPTRPHVSLGYAVSNDMVAAVQDRMNVAQMRDTRQWPIGLTIASVDLVSVHRDFQRGIYTWETITTYGLSQNVSEGAS